jgi:hypothetical protein
MTSVPFTQFLRPDGRQQEIRLELPDAVEPKLKEIRDSGCRLTAEVLSTGVCSFCVEEPALGDFDIILVPNGSKVPEAITSMLLRFDLAKFAEWKKESE